MKSNNDEKGECRTIRHPTEEKKTNPTYSLPPISIGKRERALLRYLKDNKELRFNVKNYSRISNIDRSTIYDILNKLSNLELVKREIANNKIMEKGIILLESEEGGVSDSSRRECRTAANLSTHYHKFKLPISDKTKFNISRISELAPIGYKENKLFNLHQIIINMEDGVILVNPKHIIINLFDVITSDVDESDFKCFSRAINYTEKLMEIGIETEGIIIESGHWARIESALSNFLYEKVNNRYFLDLGNGKKFWIDHSRQREHETNDKEFERKIDEFFLDLNCNETIPLSKVSDYIMQTSLQMNHATHALTALANSQQALTSTLQAMLPKQSNETEVPKEKPDYFG